MYKIHQIRLLEILKLQERLLFLPLLEEELKGQALMAFLPKLLPFLLASMGAF